jgi:hypothetical protein
MTIERPMFPPRAESADAFPLQPAIGQRERENRLRESRKPVGGLSRRVVLAGVASVAALPVAAAAPVTQAVDAELIELGARFEPLVDQYYAVRKVWAEAMITAHSERDRRFGPPEDRDYRDTPEIKAACAEIYERSGLDDACARQSAIFKEMAPLANAINAASVTSIEGLRAKALVAFWEVAPLCADQTAFHFEDAYPFQHLFAAVAEFCGLTEKVAATGYELPDIGIVEAAPDDDADDEGEEA